MSWSKVCHSQFHCKWIGPWCLGIRMVIKAIELWLKADPCWGWNALGLWDRFSNWMAKMTLNASSFAKVAAWLNEEPPLDLRGQSCSKATLWTQVVTASIMSPLCCCCHTWFKHNPVTLFTESLSKTTNPNCCRRAGCRLAWLIPPSVCECVYGWFEVALNKSVC